MTNQLKLQTTVQTLHLKSTKWTFVFTSCKVADFLKRHLGDTLGVNGLALVLVAFQQRIKILQHLLKFAYLNIIIFHTYNLKLYTSFVIHLPFPWCPLKALFAFVTRNGFFSQNLAQQVTAPLKNNYKRWKTINMKKKEKPITCFKSKCRFSKLQNHRSNDLACSPCRSNDYINRKLSLNDTGGVDCNSHFLIG